LFSFHVFRVSAGVSKPTSSSNAQITSENAKLRAMKEDLARVPEEGWIKAFEQEDLKGPLMILIESYTEEKRDAADGEKAYYTLTAEEERATISVQEGRFPTEPLSISSVFIGQTLIPNVFCFKSAYGKYLSADGIGRIHASKEAVGPTEEWTLIRKDGGWALQSGHGTFLSVEAGGKVRGDKDSMGFSETFTILCQAAKKRERLIQACETELKSTGSANDNLSTLANEEERKYQSFGWGTHRKPLYGSTKDLEEAAQSGNLHEALLQRRIKSKHDPFC